MEKFANSPLAEKCKSFALNVVNMCKQLRVKREYVFADQLLRSGTSIGANIMEAQYAVSRADFISKMHIALKECNETEYWLELINRAGFQLENNDKTYNECLEIKKMLIATCKSTKLNE